MQGDREEGNLRLAIIGPGRLGRSLAVLWSRQGHRVSLIGREQPIPETDARILTVPDSQIAPVAARLPPGPILLHCSGALPVEVLRPHRPAGSLHPLMTFPGPEVGLPELQGAFAALAGDREALQLADTLARQLGLQPFEVPGDRRLYHASAVIAGNLTTVLVGQAAQVLAAAGVPEATALAVLAPLAEASARNAVHGVASALTGPIPRGDDEVLQSHRQALIEHGFHDLCAVYDTLVRQARVHLGARESDKEGEG